MCWLAIFPLFFDFDNTYNDLYFNKKSYMGVDEVMLKWSMGSCKVVGEVMLKS